MSIMKKKAACCSTCVCALGAGSVVFRTCTGACYARLQLTAAVTGSGSGYRILSGPWGVAKFNVDWNVTASFDFVIYISDTGISPFGFNVSGQKRIELGVEVSNTLGAIVVTGSATGPVTDMEEGGDGPYTAGPDLLSTEFTANASMSSSGGTLYFVASASVVSSYGWADPGSEPATGLLAWHASGNVMISSEMAFTTEILNKLLNGELVTFGDFTVDASGASMPSFLDYYDDYENTLTASGSGNGSVQTLTTAAAKTSTVFASNCARAMFVEFSPGTSPFAPEISPAEFSGRVGMFTGLGAGACGEYQSNWSGPGIGTIYDSENNPSEIAVMLQVLVNPSDEWRAASGTISALRSLTTVSITGSPTGDWWLTVAGESTSHFTSTVSAAAVRTAIEALTVVTSNYMTVRVLREDSGADRQYKIYIGHNTDVGVVLHHTLSTAPTSTHAYGSIASLTFTSPTRCIDRGGLVAISPGYTVTGHHITATADTEVRTTDTSFYCDCNQNCTEAPSTIGGQVTATGIPEDSKPTIAETYAIPKLTSGPCKYEVTRTWSTGPLAGTSSKTEITVDETGLASYKIFDAGGTVRLHARASCEGGLRLPDVDWTIISATGPFAGYADLAVNT